MLRGAAAECASDARNGRAGDSGMDIQDMRIFARVAAVQNLSAVGTELGLTPAPSPNASRRWRTSFRARLFDRTTRSIRITEEGATFLAHVERILSEIEAARASVDDKVEQAEGQAQDLGARVLRPALSSRRRCASSCAPIRRSRCRSTCTTAGQSAGGRLRRRRPHRRAVGLQADRQAPCPRPAHHRRLRAIWREHGRPQRPEELARALLPGARRLLAVDLHERRTRVRCGSPAASIQQRRHPAACRDRGSRPDPHFGDRGPTDL